MNNEREVWVRFLCAAVVAGDPRAPMTVHVEKANAMLEAYRDAFGPRDDGQGWAVDVFDGRRAWSKTHLGESPLNKAEAHRLAHKLRDPKFYTARTKRAVNSGGAL